MTTKNVQAPNGFTIVEVLVAITMLMILISTIGVALNHTQGYGLDVHHREIAQIIARNQLEHLRAFGVSDVASFVGERQVNHSGADDPSGLYTLTVVADTTCEGGVNVGGGRFSGGVLDSSACPGRRAVLVYGVTVEFPSSSTDNQVHYRLSLSDRNRYGEVVEMP